MNKSFLAIIPARYGSTRFPGKPLANIDNKPMIQHVYERARRFFAHVYVATDDRSIFEKVQAFGGQAVMTSDLHQSGTDRCAEAHSTIENGTGSKFDVIVNVQGDEPFIDPAQLELLASCFQHPQTQIATLVKTITQNHELTDVNKPKVIVNTQSEAIYFSRAAIPYYRNLEQSAWCSEHRYYKHIGLYAYRSDILHKITQLPQSALETAESLEQLRWIENGYKIAVRETNIENLSVDTPEDLEHLQ